MRRRFSRLAVAALEGRLAPAVFTVTTNASFGAGSLAAAITSANGLAGADSIVFDAGFFASAKTIMAGLTLDITDSVTITGTAASKCILSGNNSYRVLNISGGGTINVTLEKLTITAGRNTSGGSGGGISASDENLTLNECVVNSNTAISSSGGGIALDHFIGGGTLTINNSTISGNAGGSFNRGGGIYSRLGVVVTIRNSTVSGNTTGSDGAGIAFYSGGSLLVENSTISGNTAPGFSSEGGGIYFRGSVSGPNSIILRNSTLSNNSAGGYGGGIFAVLPNGSTGISARIQNATVTANKSARGGGGLATANSPLVTFSLESSIVAGNTHVSTPDLLAQTVTGKSSAVGSKNGAVSFIDLGGNLFAAALSLGGLANNGGPTLTHALGASSAAINVGENALGLINDQRGQPRSYVNTDMGAFEYIPPGVPYAQASFTDVTAAAVSTQLKVTFIDDVGISVASLTDGDLRITGSNGFLAAGKFVSVDLNTDGTPRVATYSVDGPGGSWDALDFATYTVAVEPNQVFDTSSNAILFGNLGTFKVVIPNTFVVTTTADSGAGSLRQAVLDANANPAADSITFNLSGNSTIALTSTVTITDSVTVVGPGVDQLTVTGNTVVRPFTIINAAAVLSVALSGFTISQGGSTIGGGIHIDDDSVSVTDMVFSKNRGSSLGGGAIMTRGLLTATRVQFLDNSAKGVAGPGSADGGAILGQAGAALNLVDCYFSGNGADDKGGAIEMNSAPSVFNATNCTFANNSAADGGALSLTQSGTAHVLKNCTLSGNTASRSGGAVYVRFGVAFQVLNCTVTGNSAGTGLGGAIATSPGLRGTLSLAGSVIAGNSNASLPDLATSGSTVTLTNAAIGSPFGFYATTPSNLPYGLSPHLGPLQNNGGFAPTHLPLAGSPLRDRGSNAAGLPEDQRGTGFPRLIGAAVDVGAIESADATGIPTALATLFPNVSGAGGTTYQLKITYADDVGMDPASFGTGDLRVVGPNGFDVVADFVAATNNGASSVVTYEINAAGGAWDAGDNGVYTLQVQPSEVLDGATNAVLAGSAGSFRVAIAQTFVVTNTSDANPGSLRAAVAAANFLSGTNDTITFDSAVFTGGQTITLTTGQLSLLEAVVIQGPGSTKATVSGNGVSRIFNVDAAPVLAPISISGLTLANGRAIGSGTAAQGGAILLHDDALTLTDVALNSSTADNIGGAIAANTSAGSLTLIGCSFANNKAGSFSNGGAVSVQSPTFTVSNSTFTNNLAYSGGAIAYDGASGITLTGVQFTGNSASNNGGAIYITASNPLTITNGTFTGNSSTSDGGAIYRFGGASTFNSSSFTNNSAKGSGGALYLSLNGMTLRNSTVANNTATATGGGIHLSPGSTVGTLVDASTISGNKSGGNGGGLNIASGFTAPSLFVQNSTISGNSSGGVGGGIAIGQTTPTFNVINSTIVGNTATTNGGGIGATATVTLNLTSTIVSGNTAPSPDLFTTATVNAAKSAIGSKSGVTTFNDQGGNLTFGAALNLGPLANNGGPTQTHALLPGSPCINAGSNPLALNVDQRGVGRVVGVTDIGAFELQGPPRILGVSVNGGAAQRSLVTSVQLFFNKVVTLPVNPATAFSLVRLSDSAVVNLAASVVNSATSVVTLTFTGGAVDGTSLADGRYALTAFASLITTEGGPLDGNGDGTAGDDYSLVSSGIFGVFRLFGDADGDADADNADFVAFRLAFGTGPSIFDIDGDGDTDNADFTAFRTRFGTMI